ncbi:GINS complex Sld5 component [Vararia minispora EC-137]|uniref:GINS complex Sld5 component n=1 Tax=Vararia minispora EC-137 TaxID=1314806 RepID=A0ACB8Q9L1_9AGAM|nr:GINS complex Sld5 component [Vararia minispora EC-137]
MAERDHALLESEDALLQSASPLANGLGVTDTPLQQLIRQWQNERYAPEILAGHEAALNVLLDHIRRQSDTIQHLRNDPGSSEDEHFRIMLAQTEIERVKFVVRSYIRTRLHKIEQHARLIVDTPGLQGRLSQTELNHAQRRFAKLTETYFHMSVLQALPEDQRGLDDDAAFVPPMIPEPNRSHSVFVHAREDCPPVPLPDSNFLTMRKGLIVLTPYSVIEPLLADGSIELV